MESAQVHISPQTRILILLLAHFCIVCIKSLIHKYKYFEFTQIEITENVLNLCRQQYFQL